MASVLDPLALPLLRPREIEDLLLLDLLLPPDHDPNANSFYNGEHLKYERMTPENFNKLTDEESKSRYR